VKGEEGKGKQEAALGRRGGKSQTSVKHRPSPGFSSEAWLLESGEPGS